MVAGNEGTILGARRTKRPVENPLDCHHSAQSNAVMKPLTKCALWVVLVASVPAVLLLQRGSQSGPVSTETTPTLHFHGFQITATNRLAVFTITNCTSREMTLSGFDKEAKTSEGWADIEAVYGDIWWVYRGRQSLGNPRVGPGRHVTLYAIAPSAPKWRLSLRTSFRVTAGKELKWRVKKIWESRNPLEFWRGRLYGRGETLSSVELGGE